MDTRSTDGKTRGSIGITSVNTNFSFSTENNSGFVGVLDDGVTVSHSPRSGNQRTTVQTSGAAGFKAEVIPTMSASTSLTLTSDQANLGFKYAPPSDITAARNVTANRDGVSLTAGQTSFNSRRVLSP